MQVSSGLMALAGVVAAVALLEALGFNQAAIIHLLARPNNENRAAEVALLMATCSSVPACSNEAGGSRGSSEAIGRITYGAGAFSMMSALPAPLDQTEERACKCPSFFFVVLIQLQYERKHFGRQILWNFIARPQLLSDHRAHGTTRHRLRPGHVIRFIA